MKKGGFTLIELLAVIVILAILSLITVPIVLNIIDNSKKKSNLRSVEGYAKALESTIYSLYGDVISETIIDQNVSGITVESTGNKVSCTVKQINEDGISLYGCKVGEETGYCYKNGVAKYGEECSKSYSNGDIVYFDVEQGTSCTASQYNNLNSNEGYNGIDNKVNDQTSCLKFYAFSNTDNTRVNLILDHDLSKNITYSYSYCSKNYNNNLVIDYSNYLNKLELDTKDWKGTLTSESKVLDYSKYKARFITKEEKTSIPQVSGVNTFVFTPAKPTSNDIYMQYGNGDLLCDNSVVHYLSYNYSIRPVIEVYKHNLN